MTALLKALSLSLILFAASCSQEPIDIDTLTPPDEIPSGPGIIEKRTGKKLEVGF